ncbi:hypothetical protein [Pseudosulfitobacter pseudonitzschiae]|uniref:hypothetical protein n=1 Tax=Pseudosulfitobacter pseudonitzschiae TaxID=1402135 RepID=UPI001AF2CC1E|nr:hypothetical protein [Pseudosulfitobacter pseudonitzschiae]MBM1817401.1 hypothetical protein [Pseudosulfitobacter pseudonitzschiae]MBM1834599.1 hypothetical protein [Pseudosulfitobacter pseudonitzschiae]MBM1839463.1 hypothetical protein [Pseudosulfitobacter pseudonitzschiae]MBM1844314.1 hypothetical protein [Pseudosulfitobacter pseudonitzschiae]MBM1849148.1 hypothetical protein [Pseudosulfitobacter pseudonitzschiae]
MTNNTGDSSKANTARVAIMKQLRLVRAPERPNDAVLEITTVQGPQRFLLPKSAMKAFAEKLVAFEQSDGPDKPTQN